MVDVRYEPVREVVVHDATKMSVKDLVVLRIASSTSQPWLWWCDGVLFTVSFAADAKTYDEKLEKGIMVFNRVFYAEMPAYVPIISMDTDFGGIKVNVEDLSSVKVYKMLATWAKSHKGD